jgi:glycosyltransferase involved in cell wall biosynthesis
VLLTREFVGHGHQVVVAARKGVLAEAITAVGGRVVALKVELRSPSAFRGDVRSLRAILRDERPDVVHFFSAKAGILLWAAMHPAPLRPRPFVVSSVMGLQDAPDESWPLTHGRNMGLTLGADRILIIAPAIDRMMRKLPIRRSRLVWQPVVGIQTPTDSEIDAGRAARKALGIAEDERLVLTIGALAPRKSHELFVRAAAAVLAMRKDTHFGIVGSGPLRGEIEDEIDRLGIGERVKLLGYQKEILPLLRAADVCVKPGILEGFIGITVLEAQARGVPVVAFDTEDVRLAITDGENGLIVPAGDTAAMGAAIARLLDDREFARRLGKRAMETVRPFDIRKVARGLEEFYARRGG